MKYKFVPVKAQTGTVSTYIGITESASYINGMFDSGTTQTEM